MSFSGFWKNIGKGLAKIAVVSAQAAIWASSHPEVINIVNSIVEK